MESNGGPRSAAPPSGFDQTGQGVLENAALLVQASLETPARHPRIAVVIGRLLGAAFLVCFATGLYSHYIQDPLPWMWFPNDPSWLYRVSQGVHVIAGIACIPLLLGKLYTVFPLLFAWPPVRSVSGLLERASIALFVAASLVQLAIGLLNTLQWYAWPFSFRRTHFALAWIIVASLSVHIGVKLPIIARWWRRRDSIDDSGQLLPVGPGEGELRAHEHAADGVTGYLQRLLEPSPPAVGAAQPPHRARRSRYRHRSGGRRISRSVRARAGTARPLRAAPSRSRPAAACR